MDNRGFGLGRKKKKVINKTKNIFQDVCDIVYEYKSFLISKVQYQLNLYFCEHCLSTDDILQELYLSAMELSNSYNNNRKMKLHTFITNFAPFKAVRNIVQKYSPSLVRVPDWKYRTRTVGKEFLKPYVHYDKINDDDNKDKNPDKKYGRQVCLTYDYLIALDNKILFEEVWKYILSEKFLKENSEIIKLKAIEEPDEKIAKKLNIKCSTLRDRIKRVRKVLRNRFEEK